MNKLTEGNWKYLLSQMLRVRLMESIKKTEYKIDAVILSGSRIHEYLEPQE